MSVNIWSRVSDTIVTNIISRHLPSPLWGYSGPLPLSLLITPPSTTPSERPLNHWIFDSWLLTYPLRTLFPVSSLFSFTFCVLPHLSRVRSVRLLSNHTDFSTFIDAVTYTGASCKILLYTLLRVFLRSSGCRVSRSLRSISSKPKVGLPLSLETVHKDR